ncbi:MAG: hypothetical protein AABZ47_07000, partial [Planctomycetota bacterium]
EDLLTNWTRELERARTELDGLLLKDNPQEAAAVRELKTLYRDFSKSLNDITAHGRNVQKSVPNMPEPQAAFLRDAGARYAPLIASVEEEKTKLDELKPLKVEDVLRELTPNGNPILVQTATDAKIVDFSSVWPPMDQSGGARRAAFKDRGFKGEEKLTSAILRATHKEQTAILFVRYGGPPLFFGGFMPGQPQAPFAAMKQQLEDANFVVEEWDLKSKDTPPDIDPKPTKTIFVVLKPTAPEQKMPGQPSQDPPFGENHRKSLMAALGDNPKALFIAGWAPGPFGPVPSTYEFGEYLKTTWGITVDTSALLIETVSTSPGKYGVNRRDWMSMRDIQMSGHDISRGAQGQRVAFPWSAPLNLASPPPAGVELVALATHPKKDGVWGVKNLQAYEDQQSSQGYFSRVETDLEGPFDLAAAAKKGDGKVVVVSSRQFADDTVAFSSEVTMTSQGIALRSRNPGNVTLLINALHWLNDNMQFMNIGRPIDAAILTIPEPSTARAVQSLTIFVWPMLALASGGIAYWMRRR